MSGHEAESNKVLFNLLIYLLMISSLLIRQIVPAECHSELEGRWSHQGQPQEWSPSGVRIRLAHRKGLQNREKEGPLWE